MADLARYGTCTLVAPAAQAGGCTTCGDVGVPVRVLRLLDDSRALCEDRTGRTAEIATDFTPDAAPGDVLLVHMRTAIACVREDQS